MSSRMRRATWVCVRLTGQSATRAARGNLTVRRMARQALRLGRLVFEDKTAVVTRDNQCKRHRSGGRCAQECGCMSDATGA